MLTCNNILKFETFVDTLQTFVKKVAFYDVISFICVKENKIKNGNSKIGKIILKFKLFVYWYISRIINFRFDILPIQIYKNKYYSIYNRMCH